MDCGQSQLLNIPDGFIHVTLKASKVLTCADYIIHYGFWFDMKGQTWRFLISAGEVSTSQWASNRPRFACLLWRKNDDRVQRLLAKIIDSGQNLNGLSWGKHCKCFLMGTFRTCVLEMKMGTNGAMCKNSWNKWYRVDRVGASPMGFGMCLRELRHAHFSKHHWNTFLWRV